MRLTNSPSSSIKNFYTEVKLRFAKKSEKDTKRSSNEIENGRKEPRISETFAMCRLATNDAAIDDLHSQKIVGRESTNASEQKNQRLVFIKKKLHFSLFFKIYGLKIL